MEVRGENGEGKKPLILEHYEEIRKNSDKYFGIVQEILLADCHCFSNAHPATTIGFGILPKSKRFHFSKHFIVKISTI